MKNLENSILYNADQINIDKQMCLSYDDAISILTSQGKFHISLGLERVGKVLELLGNPQETLKVIHVAGTNGKGSTCAMLSSVLTEAGYKTGFYSSPHLVDYTERIKINGNDISKEDFARLVFKVVQTADKVDIRVTEFEILTAAAFMYFKEKNVDLAILETGLGGRLDATNVIRTPILTVITSIDFDHTDRLGNTIEKIAFEKAGIIKNNVPVITTKDNKGLDVIRDVASERSSELIIADSSCYSFKSNTKHIYDVIARNTVMKQSQNLAITMSPLVVRDDIADTNDYEIALSGLWQLQNLSLVLEAVSYLNKIGTSVSRQALRSGLKKTSWPARFQYMKDKKLILDGAHNVSGAKLLRESLDLYFPTQKRVWIYSSLNTKDYESIINTLFRSNDTIICTKSISKNAVQPPELSQKISTIYPGIKVCETQNVIQAYDKSSLLTLNGELTIISGSLYTIGELLKHFYQIDKL
jgi:dihydrofolate synthase/folylpolyglutamate synthase